MLRTLCFHCCGPRVRSLVRELRPYKPHGVAKKKKENMRFAWGKNLWLGQVPGCKSWLLRLARGGLRSATGPSSCVTVQDKTCHLIRWLCWEDPLEKGTAMHSSTLAWRIPRTEEPCGLLSMGSQRVGHDWATHPDAGIELSKPHWILGSPRGLSRFCTFTSHLGERGWLTASIRSSRM